MLNCLLNTGSITDRERRTIVEKSPQVKTRVLISLSVMLWEIVLNPAFLYSSLYFIIINQKWGSCHRNMNREKRIISLPGNVPPAAVYPMNGGMAPTRLPGTIASGVILFK